MTKTKRYYYKGNPLKQYRAFCAVARNGKMVDAADELFLSQSARASTSSCPRVSSASRHMFPVPVDCRHEAFV